MSRSSVLTKPAHAAAQRPAGRSRRAAWLVPCCYLLAAFALTWHLWPDPAGRVPALPGSHAAISNDVYLTAWSLRYVAASIAHFHLPDLVTTQLNWPRGINLMWNTSLLLPALVLTPVTLVAGPTVSMAILLVLGFAGSATTMFWVARRWGASTGAATLAGAVYGFSPAMRVAADAHYHLQLAFLPPLIVHLVLRLATGQGRAPRTGLWLGLTVAAQFFIAEELLVDTILAGVIVLTVLAASRPSRIAASLGDFGAGLGVAVCVAAILCGYPLSRQLFGPLHESGSPWRVAKYGNRPADFVTAPPSMLLHGPGFLAYLTRTGQRLVEDFCYLGWPMLVLLVLLTVLCWRDLRARIAGVTFVVLEVLSLGGRPLTLGAWHVPADNLPWYWLRHLPGLSQVLPNRLSLLADGAGALLLAFAADRVWRAAAASRDWRGPALLSGAALALAAALVPVLPAPIQATAVPAVPAGFQQVLAGLHLKPDAAVLVLPINGAYAMELQALTGDAFSVVGGYCIVPDKAGHATPCGTHSTLTIDQQTTQLRLTWLAVNERRSGPSHRTMDRAIRDWRPTAVITMASPNSRLGRYLYGFFGRPTARDGQVTGWRVHRNGR